MSLDGRLLARARGRLESMRREREAAYSRREREVYEKAPGVRELDADIRGTLADAVGYALSNSADAVAALDDIREHNLELQAQRAREIEAAGFPPDYLDMGYMCEKCLDTGYIGPEPCSCLLALYAEEQRLALSDLFKLGGQSFDSFDLSWYDEKPDPLTGVSPRSHMEMVKETCFRYAESFGPRSMNLFLSGAPGLGKTFLSACIARAVSEKGFSVVYDTAQTVFSKFEDDRFSRGDTDSARSDIRRFLSCDLLILDDLGTELTTSLTQSALYELVNTRLTGGHKTVINSNLSPAELHARYSPQIVSRIEGEYHILRFYGKDIRLLRKTRRQRGEAPYSL